MDAGDKSTLTAKLASAETFKNAGIDYPYNLPKLKFQIEDRAGRGAYVKVTSLQPINEPFVTLLVELSWPSGKLLREYTFLLDPVDFKPEQPKAAEVKPIEPVLATPVAVEPLVETPVAAETTPVAKSAVVEPTAPAEQVPTTPEPVAQEAAPVVATEDPLSKEEAIVEPALSSQPITVRRGDTLSKIAARIKPANVSLERMLVALYRENAGVFDEQNMNRIRAGKILNIPQGEAIHMLPQADAEEEIRVQAADWNVYRQKLAAARSAAVERADKREAAGKISTAVVDKSVSDKEQAKEVLKLSKGEAPGDKAVGGGKSTAQDKAIAKEEDAIAKKKTLKESQERTAILEKNIKDMQRLAELKKGNAASAPAAAVTLNAASAPKAASSVAEAKPKVVPPPPVAEQPQPSFVDQLLSDPIYLAGGVAVLLLLGGLGFVVVRRGKQDGKKDDVPSEQTKEDAGSTTGRIAAPVAPSPDTGDFTQSATPSAATASVDAEEVDPIGEADLFLTFGRDAQAEEVLKEALKKNPNNIPVKLKLLSIYAGRKDTNSFYSYAREIKESGDESAWGQAAAMGLKLEPSNPFYGGTGSAAEGNATEAAAPAVDFDLGFSAPSAPVIPDFSTQNTVVMEAESKEKTTILSSAELSAASSTPMDFDITGTHPGVSSGGSSEQEATTALNMDDLVFDVTAIPSKAASNQEPTPSAESSGGLAFDLDFPMDIKLEDTPAKPVVTAPDLGLGEISLNLDNLGASSSTNSAAPKDERWQEVATKLDLAKAYQEMGDAAGAKEILDEVLRDGDEQQRETAQTLLQQL
jgi:pilus assembly protein FimV